MNVKTDVVRDHDFRYPITDEQYEQARYDFHVASGLVRLAHTLDLEAIAEKVTK